ncbi:uncharacterized protein LOC117100286 [Anneissia japonica]|uniref:uncharacterized protein LOC117100286 n=1 Tax=Anneissia japonica TaxID=1529436 RepID=UPI001425A0B7|nr:uncharacterized protein LOC117100286 [Anneissia japonica]
MADVKLLTARSDFSIPSEGRQTHLNEILNLNSLQGKYIQATIFKKWELVNSPKGHRLKVVLEESIANEIHRINLFLLGEYAVKFACVKEEHEVLIFNGKLEKSTTYMNDKVHPFAILLKDFKPMPEVQVRPPAPSRPHSVIVSGKNTSTSAPSTTATQNTLFNSTSVILHQITPPSTSKGTSSRKAPANSRTSGVSLSSMPKSTTSKGPPIVLNQNTPISTVSASSVNSPVNTPPIVSADMPSTPCARASNVNTSVNAPPIVSTDMPLTPCARASNVNTSVNAPPIVSTDMPSTSRRSVSSVNASVNTPPILSKDMPSTCTSTSCKSSVNASINTTFTVSESDRPSTSYASKQIPNETPKSRSSAVNYTYTPLADVREGMIVNVYGVVKFFKPPYRGRGPDYCMTIRIIDSSLDKNDKGLLCILFMKQKDSLPNIVTTGDIVRLHRLEIRMYNGGMQGRNSPGFAALVFHGSGTDYRHRSTTPLYTFTENDKIHVDDLRNWVQGDAISQEKQHTLSSIKSGEYMDICVQIVAKLYIPDENCIALKVWDGTLFKSSLRWVNIDNHEFEWDLNLAEKAKGYLVDVWIYDDHVEAASKLKAGQFIKLFNLHAPPFRQTDVLELVLHRGTSYGRGVIAIPESDPAVAKMKVLFDTADQRLKDSGIKVADLTLTKRKQLGFLNCSVSCPESETQNRMTLSSIKSSEYFDICVQIVASVAIPEESCIALKVWDGTLCKSSIRWVNIDEHEFEWDLDLAEKAKGYVVDVWIYDDHVEAASKLKAGQFIKLFNLHAPPFRQADVLELVLHRGTSYGRGVKCIPESDPAVTEMKALFSTADQRLKESSIKVEELSLTERKQLGFLNCNIPASESEAVGDDNQKTICMQESATIISGHHDLAVSSIHNVLQISSPNLSKVRAKVISFWPKTIEDFVILSCPECGLRANTPTASETNKARREARKRLEKVLPQARRRSSRIQKKRPGKGKTKFADMVDFIIYHAPENTSEKKKRSNSQQWDESEAHSMITRRKRKLLDEQYVETSTSLATRGCINKSAKGFPEVQNPSAEESVEKTKSSVTRVLGSKQGCDPAPKQNVESSTKPSLRCGLRNKNVEVRNPPTKITKSSVKSGCQKKNTKDSSKGQDPPKGKAAAARKSNISEGIPTTSQLETSCGGTSRDTAVLSTRKSNISKGIPTTSQLQAVLSKIGVIEDTNGEEINVRVTQSDDGNAGFAIIPLTSKLAINDAFKLVRSGFRVKPSSKVYVSKNLNRPIYYECPRCHGSDNTQTGNLLQLGSSRQFASNGKVLETIREKIEAHMSA